MRSASSAGSVLASHTPQAMPRIATVPRYTHAAGQCSVPAGTNNNAPMTAIQMMFCNNNFAITRHSRFSGKHDRIFRRTFDAFYPPGSGERPCLPHLTVESALNQLVDPRSLSRRKGNLLGCLCIAGVTVG